MVTLAKAEESEKGLEREVHPEEVCLEKVVEREVDSEADSVTVKAEEKVTKVSALSAESRDTMRRSVG